MAKAVCISLIVIAMLASGIVPTANTNQNDNNCCQFDSSYVIDGINQDYVGIQKINDYTLTSTFGTYSMQSTFLLREASAVLFRLLIADGFVDIQVNGISLRIVTAEFADNTVVISLYDKKFTVTVGNQSKTFIAKSDIINLKISYSLKAFKLTDKTDNSALRVDFKHGDYYNTNIVGATGLIGIGILNGNDYTVENLICGEYYSIILLQNLDLIFFSFFITNTQKFNLTTEECNIPLPIFCDVLKLEILELPHESTVTVGKDIVFSRVGVYAFKLYNDYESYYYNVEYVLKPIPPLPDEEKPPEVDPPIVIPPDEEKPPEVDPPVVIPPNEEKPPEVIPPDDEKPPILVPPEDNQHENDIVYQRNIEWVKIMAVGCGGLAVLAIVIVSFIVLNKKKRKQ